MTRWKVGDFIGARYEVEKVYGGEGQSGMGIVYICYDHTDEIHYALKTFQDRYLFSEEIRKLFKREALLWTYLKGHPYVVRIIEVEKIEDRLFMVLEYIEPDKKGRNSLTHFLGDLSLLEICEFSIEFCHGMEFAYSKGIDAHRDIKPDNIMVKHVIAFDSKNGHFREIETKDRFIKITDFGLVKAFQGIKVKDEFISSKADAALSIFKSKGNIVCGTLPYMAPEQFDGIADKRSDIYSFGIVLFQMVSGGDYPFKGKSTNDYERMHRNEKVPNITSPLFSIIEKCLEKDPDKRYQTISSLRDDLGVIFLKNGGDKDRLSAPKMIIHKVDEFDAEKMINEGQSFRVLGQFEEAMSCFDKALEIDPKNVRAWISRGNLFLDQKLFNEAISCYNKAIEIEPGNKKYWYNIGFALQKSDKFEESLEYFNYSLKIDPKYVKALTAKGSSLSQLSRYEEALLCVDKALEINPEYVDALREKGVALDELNKKEEALIFFDKAIEISPENALFWFDKGVVLDQLCKYKDAIICYNKATLLNPEYYQAWMNEGIVFEKTENIEKALVCYTKVTEIITENKLAWFRKGNILSKFKKYNEAIYDYNKAIELDSDFPEAFINRGVCYFKKEAFPEALVNFERAVILDPDDQRSWYYKGITLQKLARHDEAIICFERVLKIDPGNADTWFNMGVSYFVLEKFDQVLKCTEKAARINPKYLNSHEEFRENISKKL
jgi:tetratricopeptide (TPR) repeat protein